MEVVAFENNKIGALLLIQWRGRCGEKNYKCEPNIENIKKKYFQNFAIVLILHYY